MAITAQFLADFSQWSGAVAGAKDDLEGLKESAASVTEEQSKAAENLGRGIVDVGRKVADVAGQFIESYAEEEQATNRLHTALEAQGLATDEVTAKYAAMGTQFQQTTRFSDDAIAKAQTLFTEIGHVGPDQMQAALEAATNLSIGLGISLESATGMVAKAFATQGEHLGRLKTILGDTVPKGASMAQVLEAINSKFAGQAQKDVETYNGSMARLSNQLDDVKSKMGELIAKGLTPILDAFASLPGPVQTVVALVGVLGTALAPIAVAVGALVPLFEIAFPGALAAAGAAITPFLVPLGLIVAAAGAVYLAFKNWDAIKDICASVYNGIKTWLVDKFDAIVGWIGDKVNAVTGFFKSMADKVVLHSYVPDMINGIQQQFGRLPDVMVKPAQDATEQVQRTLGDAVASLNTHFGGGGTMAGGIGVPGSRIEEPAGGMGQRYLVSPEGYRVPLGGTGYLPMNWWEMYTGKEQTPSQLNNWYLNPRPAVSSGTYININGSVLGNPDQIANAVGDAVMSAFTRPGVRA